jgi:hypothetical protein
MRKAKDKTKNNFFAEVSSEFALNFGCASPREKN